jgi:EAL domain-containing protein (putative c-di-GMP-specific phosphodiesterase class I)/GGDEF domain-containing protein
MKLGRLLFGGVSLIFILVLVGVETIHVHFTQRNLQLQLDAHANETATALALSLSSVMQPDDTVMANTIINPVFDRGYFSSIRLTNVKGEVLVSRTMTPQKDDVPLWFRTMFAVEGPVGQAMVSSGWRQMGRVLVEVHPEFAYRQLWETATGTLAWLSILFAVALFAAWRLLLGILRPLQAVEAAALAIGERKFPELKVIARARELANVVTAMNTLSRKLRESMALEELRASRLMREAYEDLGSGTLNSRGLRQRVLAQLDSEAAPTRGALLMLSIAHLDQLNRSEGMAAGDAVLTALGTALTVKANVHNGAVGHDRGANFLAFLPGVERDIALAWAREALESANPRTPACVGIAWFDGKAGFDELLELARQAHAQARQMGESLKLLEFKVGLTGSAADWRARIEAACAEGRVELQAQAAVALSDNAVLHREITSRLVDMEGAAIPAAMFVPAVNRHGLMPRLDIEVARLLKARLAQERGRGGASQEHRAYALNVSSASLRDPDYLAEVRELMSATSGHASAITFAITFELSAQSAATDPEAAERFARLARDLGAAVALDDLELSSNSLLLARQLMPEYVKLAPAATRDLAALADQRYLVESVVALLRPLEIAVIAKGIENAEVLPVLASCGVTGAQGYAIGRPDKL